MFCGSSEVAKCSMIREDGEKRLCNAETSNGDVICHECCQLLDKALQAGWNRKQADALLRWQALGAAGLIVSIAYGPSAGKLGFSVDVMNAHADSFESVYAADSLEQAVEIAEQEAAKRGWLPQGVS